MKLIYFKVLLNWIFILTFIFLMPPVLRIVEDWAKIAFSYEVLRSLMFKDGGDEKRGECFIQLKMIMYFHKKLMTTAVVTDKKKPGDI